MNVIELRNYLLKQGKRDEFTRYFKDHFVDSQRQIGAYVPALFEIKNEANRFFWIRGFDTMEERSRFLPLFYNGEVWKKYGPAANEMMLEWHNVHLVKPLAANINAFLPNDGFFVIDYYKTKDSKRDLLIDLITKEHIPFLQEQNIQPVTLWISEMRENDFPRLPVYQDNNLLTVISGFNNEEAYQRIFPRLNIDAGINSWMENKTSLSLYPVSI
jgi:hypothetical protein